MGLASEWMARFMDCDDQHLETASVNVTLLDSFFLLKFNRT